MLRDCKSHGHFLVLACALVAGPTGAHAGAANATSFRVLHSFCAKPGCADGAVPTGGIVPGDPGVFYGVTENGGSAGLGVVFELDNAGGRHAAYKRLHSFCATDCKDGRGPSFPLIRDVVGNLYGTAPAGGLMGGGVVFELMPRGDRWGLKVLHAFCSPNSDSCHEGSAPSSGLAYQGAASGSLYDGHSPLFGMTAAGGAMNGGTVFRLTPNNGKWGAKSLHDFCLPPSCTSGATALGGLVLDPDGDIFGVANLGGAKDEGAVFKLSPAGTKYSYLVIYDFCSQQTCTDGIRPNTQLTLDAQGDLYGTTPRSGTHDAGTVFELSPDGGGFAFQVLHQFCDVQDCADGGAPAAPLALDQSGSLFGTTTQFGNAQGRGTLFELSPSQAGWIDTVLYNFCSQTNCTDGALSTSRVIRDEGGNIFGTTVAGGSADAGVVFEFRP